MPESNEEKQRTEAEFVSEVQEQIRRLPAEQHLEQMLALMSSKAFQHLGIAEETAEFKDFEQSRLAIDAFKAVLEVLEPKLEEEKAGMYRSTLSQLQLAYATHSGKDAADIDEGDDEEKEVQGGAG